MKQQFTIDENDVVTFDTGRSFQFIHRTLAGEAKINHTVYQIRRGRNGDYYKKLRLPLRSALLALFRPDKLPIYGWKHIRNNAFVKTGAWKWFGIIPKELRITYLLPENAGGLQAHFFELFPETLTSSGTQSNSLTGGKIEMQNESSGTPTNSPANI